MTKLFAQLLLSAMVGIGAAAGFNPDVKGKVVETLTEAKAAAREAVHSTFEAIAGTDLSADVSVNASAEGNTNAQTEADGNVQAKTDGNATLDLSGLFDESVSMDGSLSAETQTDVSAEPGGIGLNLTNAINSALGIGLGFGK